MSILSCFNSISENYIFIDESIKLVIGLLIGAVILPDKNSKDINQDPFQFYDLLVSPILIINNHGVVVSANKEGISFVEEFYSIDLRNTIYLPNELSQMLNDSRLIGSENYVTSQISKTDVLIRLNIIELTDNPGHTLVEIIKKESAKNIDAVMKRRIEELQNSLNELSYIISHDLVEPVRTIKSFAQIVNRAHIQKLDNKDATEDFEFILDGADRLYAMIKGMLEYSRLTAIQAPYEELDTLEVLVSVIKDLMTVTNESNANILCHNMPVIRYNKTLLSQVFSNIINNSLKYKSPERNPKIEIHAEDKGDEYLFIVEDNGIGFDNEQSERIFKMFQRLHPNDSKFSGTGIGLAICKKIIEKENGRIWAEAIEDVGAKFYFTIPKIQPT